jgi:hypothetical protein
VTPTVLAFTVVPRMGIVLLAFSLQLASRAFSWRS